MQPIRQIFVLLIVLMPAQPAGSDPSPANDPAIQAHLRTAVARGLDWIERHPATLQDGGMVQREALLQRLSGLLGTEMLVRVLNPRRRRFDERIAAETVRTRVAEALRRLADLGFVDPVDDAMLRLRPALMRFAEPVRDLSDRQAALERLVQSGEIALGDADGQDGNSDGEAAGDDPEEAGG
mgnify:CR=1 FL=1